MGLHLAFPVVLRSMTACHRFVRQNSPTKPSMLDSGHGKLSIFCKQCGKPANLQCLMVSIWRMSGKIGVSCISMPETIPHRGIAWWIYGYNRWYNLSRGWFMTGMVTTYIIHQWYNQKSTRFIYIYIYIDISLYLYIYIYIRNL